MKIKDIGGEFALIEQLDPIISVAHADLIVGVGDDDGVDALGFHRRHDLEAVAMVDLAHGRGKWSEEQTPRLTD